MYYIRLQRTSIISCLELRISSRYNDPAILLVNTGIPRLSHSIPQVSCHALSCLLNAQVLQATNQITYPSDTHLFFRQ